MMRSPIEVDRPPRVLIVDDERHNRQLLEVMLGPEALVLDTASSGEEALAKIALSAPDLILLDVMMPGMDGYVVAGRVKGDPATHNIPIIMVTALDDHDARILGLNAGAEDFLVKPVDRAELCVRVRNLLRLKAYGDYHDQYGRMLEEEVGSRVAELQESERLYRETFDAAPVGIAHVDLEGHCLRVNQRLGDLLGYSRGALEQRGVADFMRDEDIAAESAAFRQMAVGQRERHVIDEVRFRRADGGFLWGRVNVSVHRDAGGAPHHFIVVIEDITERRTLESQVRQSAKMDAVGRLAAGVAHDFNNLLTVIIGFAELVAGEPGIQGQQAKDTDEIIKAARQATGLTKQLLAFSRQQVLNAAPLDVNALIGDMARMLDRLIGDHIHVALALAPNLSMALADRGQVEQVVMNLVVNARDAMAAGGSVTIETREVELENSAFHDETVVPGPYVMVAITDTGSGMSRDVQRRLFEPFFTTKEVGKGTGLGLSTTYGIVKQSKGYVWVYSEVGQGTTFKVYLPQSPPDAASAVVAAPVTQVTRGSETVLLVEDEPGIRLFTKRILDSAGYRVIEAADGLDAERLFSARQEPVDLVVSDVIMPGCDGPELLRRLRARSPTLRVLFMSGYTDRSIGPRAGIPLSLPILHKPFTASELVRSVREILDGPPQLISEVVAPVATEPRGLA
jgi:two-component system cell cycle sensor histidine kinase/response regulator CckA